MTEVQCSAVALGQWQSGFNRKPLPFLAIIYIGFSHSGLNVGKMKIKVQIFFGMIFQRIWLYRAKFLNVELRNQTFFAFENSFLVRTQFLRK